MKNFEIRQTARDEEVEALKQAKAILSGIRIIFARATEGAEAKYGFLGISIQIQISLQKQTPGQIYSTRHGIGPYVSSWTSRTMSP